MARLPTAADLGGIPNLTGSRPVSDVSDVGQVIQQTTGQLGAGIEKAGVGLGEYALAKDRWDYAVANADFETKAASLESSLVNDQDYTTLPQRANAGLLGLRDASAQLISDPAMRDRFISQSDITLAKRSGAWQQQAYKLEGNANVAYVDQMGDSTTNQVLALPPGDPRRNSLINAQKLLFDGLATRGWLPPDEVLNRKREWAQRYVRARFGAGVESDDPTVIKSTLDELHAMSPTVPSPPGAAAHSGLSPDIDSYLGQAATQAGLDPNMVRRIVHIESSGNPNASTGSYKGLFQLSNAEFSKYGSGNILDARSNIDAGINSLVSKANDFRAKYGRDPTATELYLEHQQGEGGLAAHLANPDAPAWQNMASTAEGRQKGAGWAKQAIWGNIPDDMKRMFPGGVDTVTSRDFMNVWQQKVEGGTGIQQASGATATTGQGTSEDSGLSSDQILSRNQQYIKPDAGSDYQTTLPPNDEAAFRKWVSTNKIPFDPNDKKSDYDMRGFWAALQAGDPRAKQAIDQNDGKMHFPDYWKTPYDLTFSKQSKFAGPNAPDWNDKDQLVTADGKVVYDDRAPAGSKIPDAAQPTAGTVPQQQPGQKPSGIGDLLRPDQRAALISAGEAKLRALQSAAYTDQERAHKLQQQQLKDKSDAAENEVIKDAFSASPQMSANDVANNKALLPDAKLRLIGVINRANKGEPEAEISRNTLTGLLADMRRPDGDPQKITTNDPIYSAFIAGRLTRADFTFAQKEFQGLRSTDGDNLEKRKAEFMKGVQALIDTSNPLMGKIDATGKQNVYTLEWDIDHKIADYRKAGKNPYDLFDPSKPDYMGSPKALAPYQKTMQQSSQDLINKLNPPANAGSRLPSVTGGRTSIMPRQPGESIDAYLKRTGEK